MPAVPRDIAVEAVGRPVVAAGGRIERQVDGGEHGVIDLLERGAVPPDGVKSAGDAPGFFVCRIFCAEPASTSAENAPGPQCPPEASAVEAATAASSTAETKRAAPIRSARVQRFQSA